MVGWVSEMLLLDADSHCFGGRFLSDLWHRGTGF